MNRNPNPIFNLQPLLAGMIACCLLACAADAYATPARFAVVLGNNIGEPDEEPLRYAEQDARKIKRVLMDLGGYKDERVKLLLGASATEARNALIEIESAAADKEGALILFYYSGHGDETALHLNQTKLPLTEIHDFIRNANSSIRIALVDSCRSGALVRTKGAKLGPVVDVDFLGVPKTSGSIVISSSGIQESSQESDSLGGSFFTHYWVAGLYGQADDNQDGVVTLEEAYGFAHYHTVMQTIKSRAGVQHPSYMFRLQGEKSVILSNLRRNTARVTISNDGEDGRYFVVDSLRRLLLTEIVPNEKSAAAMQLPPGRYEVRKREKGQLRSLSFNLADGESRQVRDASMTMEKYDADMEKGNQISQKMARSPLKLFLPRTHSPMFNMGVRSPLVNDMTLTPEMWFGYRFGWNYLFVEPRLVMRSAGLGPNRLSIIHTEADLGATIGPRARWGTVDVLSGIDAGAVLISQKILPSTNPGFSSGPQGFMMVAAQGNALAEVGLLVGMGVRLSAKAYGGAAFVSVDSQVAPILQYGTAVGVGYVF
jgi:hypothetical protein